MWTSHAGQMSKVPQKVLTDCWEGDKPSLFHFKPFDHWTPALKRKGLATCLSERSTQLQGDRGSRGPHQPGCRVYWTLNPDQCECKSNSCEHKCFHMLPLPRYQGGGGLTGTRRRNHVPPILVFLEIQQRTEARWGRALLGHGHSDNQANA